MPYVSAESALKTCHRQSLRKGYLWAIVKNCGPEIDPKVRIMVPLEIVFKILKFNISYQNHCTTF